MKMKQDHIVPLTSQMLEILFELKKLTGEGKYLFPSIRTTEKPISDNTINGALRRLGYRKDEMCGHGFRAMASTLLNETGKYKSDWIEMQLSHSEQDSARKPYNRAEYLPHRKKMMKEYSDYLCQLRDGADVIKLHSY
jgi:integrase